MSPTLKLRKTSLPQPSPQMSQTSRLSSPQSTKSRFWLRPRGPSSIPPSKSPKMQVPTHSCTTVEPFLSLNVSPRRKIPLQTCVFHMQSFVEASSGTITCIRASYSNCQDTNCESPKAMIDVHYLYFAPKRRSDKHSLNE